jgi:hypothetical protein
MGCQLHEAEDELLLETVGLTLPVEALYRQVQFESDNAEDSDGVPNEEIPN